MTEPGIYEPAHVAYVGSYTRPTEGGSGNGTDGISVYAVEPETAFPEPEAPSLRSR